MTLPTFHKRVIYKGVATPACLNMTDYLQGRTVEDDSKVDCELCRMVIGSKRS